MATNKKQWQIELASDLGTEDGYKAVEELQREQGIAAVAQSIAPGDLGLEEAAQNAHAHSFHRESEINGTSREDKRDPFRWDDDTRAAYYRAYDASARKRAAELANEAA